MPQLIYALRFTGQATPAGPDGNVLHATTTAPSTTLTSRIGPAGLEGVLEALPDGEATFASEATFTSETDFLETGTITFGAGNSLRFSTVGSGYLSASADAQRKHGAVIWRVDQGEGQFAGATGFITSNFFVDEQLGIVDHHFGVLLLP